MSPPLDSDLPRREFLKAAVALGGASALSACLDRFEGEEPVPGGVSDPSTLPVRQYAWGDHLPTDDAGNTLLPHHQTLWYLTLPGEGAPSADAREGVETALSTLDRAYERSNEGLVYSVGYSPSYFERFDESLPESVDLPQPRRLSSFEQPELDTQDALLHLGSDRADALLEAEQALRGEAEEANGVPVETALTDVLDLADRRTGFMRKGLPHQKAEETDLTGVPADNPIPEDSPLFMGFMAGFRANQATEDYVAIGEGPFADGTTKHVANIGQSLEDWYGEQDFDQRVMEMFSPGHVAEDLVDGIGGNLGGDSGIDRFVEDIEEHAREYGRVGHAQKAARANRDEAGNVKLLRRHFESTDGNRASLHFPSLQRGISEFEAVRKAMNGEDVTQVTPAVRQRVNNGILEYIFVRRRGNFLVPPRDLRALPTPTGEA
ncbi:twin-arginine translocation signal domain-containing protein [Halomarina litorea]|uniref:twin-arginine translocation signal domain-containing protein n=1 Tax=Halomarina litorea TaxID=2961595 RepID=UPI0020C361AA|nr:twin-arginine translocation signal domain-containing protein [Halomarina sp. BCD28]